jgi:hypothetical protein
MDVWQTHELQIMLLALPNLPQRKRLRMLIDHIFVVYHTLIVQKFNPPELPKNGGRVMKY